MVEDPNWFRLFHEFPGTNIAIYESYFPQPQVVLLSQHLINPGVTKARAEYLPERGRSVNVKAGEGETEYEDTRGYESRDPSLPAAPKRPPKIDGLGADEPKRRRIVQFVPEQIIEKPEPQRVEPQRAEAPRKRIVTSPTTVQQPDPLPPKPTREQRIAYDKALLKAWKEKIRGEEKQEEKKGVAVRGWRMRALSAQKEIELAGESSGTQAKLSALMRRIPKDQRTWLQSGHLLYDDPYMWLRTSNAERGIFTPWIKPECVAWLVVEGRKLGIYFAARANPPGSDPSLPSDAKALQVDVQRYLDGRTSCTPEVVRNKGIRASGQVLAIDGTESLSIPAMGLFQKYQDALRESGDKTEVHEAYHRILLQRFLRRRQLVPASERASVVGKQAEQRANMLQARRVFVFNSDGCPTRFNLNFLKANGIGIEEFGAKNPTQVYMRDVRNQYKVVEWTNWFYTKVLGKKPEDCRRVFTSESLTGLYALAGMGWLG